ncbi:NmrA/HSCARG family protein [Anaeromyxobacter paludicola]|uniref:NmrA-like domain-containing protein n=1 Tax=Anaeromyxobacter paludicola TaxID=2918171 RepID=A0ABM7X9K7_9BACT|nr:NmrA/HSCARG family protein [Anaeromyxobacter paludicola]BDG08538.1 hypothetical protein AMPC_16510 [Anaeromyxobacter paludicola]
MPRSIRVVVAGATGQQGGAVARLLLEKGHRVVGLTRRPGSPAAARLRALGAEVAQADLEEGASVRAAVQGADAFFLMATPFEGGPEAEVREALRAAEAARAAGVKHLVYSSVAGASELTGIPHFDSKHEVEGRLAGLGVPLTVVAPAFFMENLSGPAYLTGLRAGELALALPPARRLQTVALADLAGVVRIVLERPTQFAGERIEVASDDLTGPEMARAVSRAARTQIDYVPVPVEAVRSRSEDLGRMFQWLDEVGYRVDLAALRRRFPEVAWHDFAGWARAQDWSVLDVASPEQPTA